MNSEDQFEQRLRQVPHRQVPAAWREEILRTARAEAPAGSASGSPGVSWLAVINTWLSNALWPHPRAWAGLAAVWLLILGLNHATREPVTERFARRAAPPSAEMRELLKEQAQLLAELVGPIEQTEAQRPKPAAAQPRSQRREEFMNA